MEARQSKAAPVPQKLANNVGGDVTRQANADRCSKTDRKFSDLKQWHMKLAVDFENFSPYELDAPSKGVLHSEALRATIPDLEARAERGSATARRFLRAYELLLTAAFDAYEGKDTRDVFRNFRAAKKLWDAIPIHLFLKKLNEMATEALEKNPEDADAVFLSVYYEKWRQGSKAEGLSTMAKTCVSVQPSVPEFHTTLGHMLACEGSFQDAVKCYDRSLGLEWNPELLHWKGHALMKMDERRREAMKVLEKYVEATEKDVPYLPFACFCVASLALQHNDKRKADEYWRKGQEVEVCT
jgi:tetratricopeptide (TPR) repeat protein